MSGSTSGLKTLKSGERRLDFETRRRIYRWLIRLSTAFLVIFFGFPIYWMAQNAFKTSTAVNGGISYFPTPETFTLAPFAVLFGGDIARYFANSIIVTIASILVVVVVSLISGYGISRFKFRGRTNFARFLLIGYMFSPIVISLPLYLIWDTIGLLNSYIGLTLVLSTIPLPFSVWLMWKFINTIPESMEESAMIAGASRVRVFVDVILPQTTPAILSVSLFAFAIAWSDFTIAKILNPSNAMTTLPPGLLRLVKQGYALPVNEMLAASLVMSLPPLLFAYFLQSYILEGFKQVG